MPEARIPETQIVEEPNRLVRAIGRWSLAALMVNIMIGSGIFGLPSALAGLLGRDSLLALLLGSVAAGVIGACFSEVASYFTVAGGPYLYTRVAYGRFVGLQVGWMYWLVRLTAPAASANLFVVYLGEFWPWANDRLPRALILGVLIGGLALVNCLGVRRAARISDVFTVAKMLPLVVVAMMGMIFLSTHSQASNTPLHAPHLREWLRASLLIVFAYGGFDAAMTATSEIKNPRRDAAAALFAALTTCTLIYLAVQWTALGTVVDLAHSSRPLTDSARTVLGSAGAGLIAAGALISVFGNLSANTLAVPRITFALAEQGDFPSFFARVHPRFRTPYVSISVFALLVWAFALGGNFAWNATLSAIARLFYYAAVCAAVPVLRRKLPGVAQFRLPAGPWFAALGVVICAILFSQVDLGGSLVLLATFVVATLNWQMVREKRPQAGTAL
jgi:basic amino acid/polyamine antiporter, APA family